MSVAHQMKSNDPKPDYSLQCTNIFNEAAIGPVIDASPNMDARATQDRENLFQTYIINNDEVNTHEVYNPYANATVKNAAEATKEQKERYKREERLRELLRQIEYYDRQIARIRDDISKMDKEIADIEAKMTQEEAELKRRYGDNWREKLKNGELDGDEIAQAYKKNCAKHETATQRRQRLIEEEAEHSKKREAARKEADGLEDELKASKGSETNADLYNQVRSSGDAEAIGWKGQKTTQGESQDINGKEEGKEKDEITVEDEIEAFMQDLARIEKMPNEMERLKAQQELIAKTSQDAKEILSWDENVSKLFEKGYFDQLNAALSTADQPNQIAQLTPLSV